MTAIAAAFAQHRHTGIDLPNEPRAGANSPEITEILLPQSEFTERVTNKDLFYIPCLLSAFCHSGGRWTCAGNSCPCCCVALLFS